MINKEKLILSKKHTSIYLLVLFVLLISINPFFFNPLIMFFGTLAIYFIFITLRRGFKSHLKQGGPAQGIALAPQRVALLGALLSAVRLLFHFILTIPVTPEGYASNGPSIPGLYYLSAHSFAIDWILYLLLISTFLLFVAVVFGRNRIDSIVIRL